MNWSSDLMPGDMSRDECLQRLAGNQVGRLAVSVHGQPIIMPVLYGVDGDVIILRNHPDTRLDSAMLARVAFEVDQVEVGQKCGWIVVVQGVGRDITDAVDYPSERRRSVPPQAGASRENGQWVELIDSQISGRQLDTETVSASASDP